VTVLVQYFKAALFLDSALNDHAHSHFEQSREGVKGIGMKYFENLIAIIHQKVFLYICLTHKQSFSLQ